MFTSAPSRGESFRPSGSSLFLKTAHIMGAIQAKVEKDSRPALSTGWDLGKDSQHGDTGQPYRGDDTHCGEEKRKGFNVCRLCWYFLWGGWSRSLLSRREAGAADSTDCALRRKLAFCQTVSTQSALEPAAAARLSHSLYAFFLLVGRFFSPASAVRMLVNGDLRANKPAG